MNSLNRLNASLIVPAAMVFVIASPIWGIQEPTSPRITITRIESTPVPTGVGELKTVIPDFSLTASPNGIYAGYGNIAHQFTKMSMLRSSIVLDALEIPLKDLGDLRAAIKDCEEKQYAYLRALVEFKNYGGDSAEVTRCFNEVELLEAESLKHLTSQQLKTLESWRQFVLLRNYGPEFLMQSISGKVAETGPAQAEKNAHNTFENALEVAENEVHVVWQECLAKWQASVIQATPENGQFDFPEMWFDSPFWAEFAIAFFCGEDQKNLNKVFQVLDCNKQSFSKYAGLQFSVFTDVNGGFTLSENEFEDLQYEMLNVLINQARGQTEANGNNELELSLDQLDEAKELWRLALDESNFYGQSGTHIGNVHREAFQKWKNKVLNEVFLPHQQQLVDEWFSKYFRQSLGPIATLAVSDEKARLKLRKEVERAIKEMESKMMNIEDRLVSSDIKQLREQGVDVEPARPPWLRVSPAAILARSQNQKKSINTPRTSK